MKCLPLFDRPPAVDPGLLHLDLADASLDSPIEEMAVTEDLSTLGLVLEV